MEGAVLAIGLPVAAVEAVHLELEGAPAVPGTHHPAVQPAREVQISQQGARSTLKRGLVSPTLLQMQWNACVDPLTLCGSNPVTLVWTHSLVQGHYDE